MKFLNLIVLWFASCTASAQTSPTLSPNDFEKAIGNGKQTQLVDVRRPDEFSKGRLRGSVNINWQDKDAFAAKTQSLDKSKPVYVYCQAGVRSAKAAEWLKENGFTQVIGLDGGIQAWKDAGKPLE